MRRDQRITENSDTSVYVRCDVGAFRDVGKWVEDV